MSSIKIGDEEILSERGVWIAHCIFTQHHCGNKISLDTMNKITAQMWKTLNSSLSEENCSKIKKYAFNKSDTVSDTIESAWTVYHIFTKAVQDAMIKSKKFIEWG